MKVYYAHQACIYLEKCFLKTKSCFTEKKKKKILNYFHIAYFSYLNFCFESMVLVKCTNNHIKKYTLFDIP